MKFRYAELAKTFCCTTTDNVKMFKIEKGFSLIWNADFDSIICLPVVSPCLFSSLNSKTSNLALLNKTLSPPMSTCCWFKSLLSVIWVGKINFYYLRREKEEIDFTFENVITFSSQTWDLWADLHLIRHGISTYHTLIWNIL